MKKLLCLVLFMLCSCNLIYADSIDRALNASTVYGGINTATGVANTFSNIQTNSSIKRNINAQTKLIQQQAMLHGIDITTSQDVRDEQLKKYHQARFYLLYNKEKAKRENDKELKDCIKKYWKPSLTQMNTIYAADQVHNFLLQREEKDKL